MKLLPTMLGVLVFLFNISQGHARYDTPGTCDDGNMGITSSVMTLNFKDDIGIPESAPAGTILWRSEEKNYVYSCWNDKVAYDAYYFFNPYNKDLGADIELGVTINGKDYLPSWTKKVIAASMSAGGMPPRRYINYRMSLFLVKKSAANSTPKNNNISIGGYIPYIIAKNIDVPTGHSLLAFIGGFGRVRLIPCTSTVSINPSTINFGDIPTSNANPEQEITRMLFTISEQRVCEKPSTYGLNGRLQPMSNALLYDNMKTLVPVDNDSVGINIVETGTNTQIPFKSDFIITPKVGTTSNSKQFEALLKWRTKTPKLGVFNAGATLDILYK